MIIMKINLVILLLLAASLSYAQKPKVNEREESSFFDLPVENVLGIIDFDLEVLAKRIHLKSQSSEYRKLNRMISWYKEKTDSVFEINREELEHIEYAYHKNVATIKDINDFDEVMRVVKNYTEEVKLYSLPIQSVEEQLGDWLAGFLNERQFSRWESYLAKQHRKNKPKMPMLMSGPPRGFL